MERLRLNCLFSLFVCLLLFSSICSAQDEFRRRRHRGGHHRSHDLPTFSNNRGSSHRKRAVNGSECVESKPAVIKAPKKNVFRQFSGKETESVSKWLYQQKDLNLKTPNFTVFSDQNILYQLELMIPNKTDVRIPRK